MPNFFKSFFSGKSETPESEKQKNDQKNFEIFKYDGLRAQRMGRPDYAVKCFIEALAICAGFNPEGGSPNLNYHTYDSHSSLFNDLKLVRSAYRNKDGYFLRAESFYNVSSELDRISGRAFQMINYGGMLHEYSHGESFLALVQNRLSGNGLFIFDEPESALSISSQFRLLIRMKELVDNKSQFIIATHSPILLSYPGADIYRITNNGFESVTYEETDQFKLTKYFINNYPKMLDELGVSEDNNI